MDTLAAVVAAGRDREGPVVTAPDRSAPYTYREFATNAWKAGNLLRHYGVRPGADLAVVLGPKDPEDSDEVGRLGSAGDPLLAVLGGAALGAVVDLTPAEPVDARALVAPDAWLDRYNVEPGCSRLAYGGPPEAADVAHFERELWSENPIEPPDPVEPGDDVLRVDGQTVTHEQLLATAEDTASAYDLTSGDSVAITGRLDSTDAIAAGVVAPLSVGATIVLGENSEATYVVGVDVP